MSNEVLERELTQKAWNYCEECKSFGYQPSIFKNMLNEMGGQKAIRTLLSKPKPSDGFTKLWEEGRLDLSMEASILENPQFHKLFTEDELQKAKEWLKKYEYPPKL